MAEKRKKEAIGQKRSKSQELIDSLQGRSLFIMDRHNWVRVKSAFMVGHEFFDNGILMLIFLSSVLLAIDNPLDDPNGQKKFILGIFDYILTAAFTIECILKIIVFGFLFNHSDSYLRQGWNQMDFIIVTISLISLAMTDIDLNIIKLLRLLRILKPLRMISRNENLKLAVQSLLNSIPGVLNVMIISLLILILFGILGVNFYKGRFFYCNMDFIPDSRPQQVWFKWECLDEGGEWVN
mmetsp:Transcript_23030/g.22378  ORF Transcript_23030/g.22378 Transcript_23030/m.22378 type:complete len:238 (-) Transcript_23030:2853-3566(-)